MKKVLTILLTLVMAVSLINLNNSHTKAEDNANDTNVSCDGIVFNNGSWTNGGQSIADLSYFGISYDSSTNTATFSKSLTCNKSNTYTLEIISDLNIKLSDNISITQNESEYGYDCVRLKGSIRIDGQGYKMTIKSVKGLAMNSYWSGDELILKNIKMSCEGNVDGAAVALKSLNLGESCEIEVKNNNATGQNAATLRVEQDTQFFLNKGYNYFGKANLSDVNLSEASYVNNVFVVGPSQSTQNARYIISKPIGPHDPEPGDMPYDDTNGFYGTATKGSSSTLTAHIANVKKGVDEVWINEAGSYLTENNQYKLEDGSIKVVFQSSFLNNLSVGTHILNISIKGKDFKVTITAEEPSPTPSPSPSKKDESCEKVIGPTWHWNNDKGICEDYGVVGTSTR